MSHNELGSTISHAHGRGDNFNPNADREAIYGRHEYVQELSRRVNIPSKSGYRGKSWAELLKERQDEERPVTPRFPDRVRTAWNWETGETVTAASVYELAKLLAITEATVRRAFSMRKHARNWLVWSAWDVPTEEEKQRMIDHAEKHRRHWDPQNASFKEPRETQHRASC